MSIITPQEGGWNGEHISSPVAGLVVANHMRGAGVNKYVPLFFYFALSSVDPLLLGW